MYQCYKVKNGTDYDKAIKKSMKQRPLWKNVMSKVGELLEENITGIVLSPDELWIDYNQISNAETKKLFSRNGKLKSIKKAKEIRDEYKNIIDAEGLSDFKDVNLLNFIYGVIKYRKEFLESLVSIDDEIYYKADFDLEARSKGLFEPITELEYQKRYLEVLENR